MWGKRRGQTLRKMIFERELKIAVARSPLVCLRKSTVDLQCAWGHCIHRTAMLSSACRSPKSLSLQLMPALR